MCFVSFAAHLALAITCQISADGAFSSHPSFPRIRGISIHVLFSIWKVSRNQAEFLFLTSLESCFCNLPPSLPWLKCLPCNGNGVIRFQTPRHPGHLYRHRRHGLSGCFPPAEDGCLAGPQMLALKTLDHPCFFLFFWGCYNSLPRVWPMPFVSLRQNDDMPLPLKPWKVPWWMQKDSLGQPEAWPDEKIPNPGRNIWGSSPSALSEPIRQIER